jgi:hypothetical protein
MSAKDSMTEYLAEHPRMIGVLFTLFVLLSQAGTAVAGSSSQIGP